MTKLLVSVLSTVVYNHIGLEDFTIFGPSDFQIVAYYTHRSLADIHTPILELVSMALTQYKPYSPFLTIFKVSRHFQ